MTLSVLSRLVMAFLFVAAAAITSAAPISAQNSQVGKQDQKAEKKIDQTGIQWVMPFPAALEKAKKENRILAIKMIAFGTNRSGCW